MRWQPRRLTCSTYCANLESMASALKDPWLLQYSEQHLMHELSLLWQTAYTLPLHKEGSTEYVALLESFATHLRNLIEFFFDPEYGGYVRAKHFFESSGDWSLSRTPEINKLYSRACNEVTHLTAKRIPGSPPEPWPVAQGLSEIETVARRFAAKASDKKLHVKVREFLKLPSNEMVDWIGNNVPHPNVASQTSIFPAFPAVSASTSPRFVVSKLVEPKNT